MRMESLKWLACPGSGCGGSLSAEPARGIDSGAEPSELFEGVLGCAKCRAEYPVILGVAVLENDLQSYLWASWNEIDSCAGETGDEISQSMRRYLGAPTSFTGLAKPTAEPVPSLQWSTSPYLQTHFDQGSLTGDLPEGWWREAVELHRQEAWDPYRFLMRAVGELTTGEPAPGLGLDVGTSTGLGAASLAGLHAYAMGIDRSFRAVLTARRLLLGKPRPLETYGLETEKGRWEERHLPARSPTSNLDFVVASAEALPVRSGEAGCVAALNTLCAVPDPGGVIDEFCRVMAPGAALALSTPFWSDSASDGESALALGGPAFVHGLLRSRFRIVAETDMVPWLLRLAKRRWNVYLCHCVVATKCDRTAEGNP